MQDTTTGTGAGKGEKFPRVFWSANVTELFERAAYYSMASFVVIYLGRLGLGKYLPSNLNGMLWTLVYFLPILSGTIADQIGFRKALLAAFVLLAGGYFLMGYPVWFGGATLMASADVKEVAGWDMNLLVPVVTGIVLIGIGGSIVKPCISGTVQKTAGARATLAFAIFYMIINIGSLVGRGISYVVRTNFGLSYIFAVAMCAAVAAFFVTAFFYRDHLTPVVKKPRKSLLRILADMFLVLRNTRFVLFLLASSGFNFLYSQVYNIFPLYTEKVLEVQPAMDIYTMANPITIVCFQLLITRIFGKMKPIRSMVVGTVIIGLSFALSLIPIFMKSSHLTVANLLPLGSLMVVLSVSMVAFGELFTSARSFEYIGSLAPKGSEGLFLGYANLPMAIGALLGAPVGAAIFNEVMCHGATKGDDGLLKLDQTWNIAGWLILVGIGLASATGLWLYNRWLESAKAAEGTA